jgi:signal transduction histidine kinase
MKQRNLTWFILGVAAILAVSLGIFVLLMKPPLPELGLMALFLLITAIISSLAGYVAYRLGWMTRSPTLRWSLLLGYLISGALTFFNVWFSARMMFASEHDLLLAIVLLVFAGGMATALGYFLSSAVTDRIHHLKQAAESLSQGELGTRVTVSGRDEVAMLAASFNEMAARLEEADRKQRELEQMRRDLIAWVGHDLRTPLTTIRILLEALSDGIIEDPETIQRYLKTGQREASALSALIDDLFQMAQLDAGGLPLDCEDGSLSDLISDTLESFSESASRAGVILDGSVDKSIDPVYMDTRRIGRVLNNLISNAIRHTPQDGRVEVRARREGGAVHVLVRDTGEGIPASDLPRIFDRFYRGEKSRSRSTGGAGLGLAISQGILQAHGGDIRVESEPGRGATFTLCLPGKP